MSEFRNSAERRDSIFDFDPLPAPLQVDFNQEKLNAPISQSARDFLNLCQIGLLFETDEEQMTDDAEKPDSDKRKVEEQKKVDEQKKVEGETPSKNQNQISDLKNDFVWLQFQKTVSSQVKILDKRIEETRSQSLPLSLAVVQDVNAFIETSRKQCTEKTPLKFNLEFGFKKNIEDANDLKKHEQALQVARACTQITSGVDGNIKLAEETLTALVKSDPSLQKSMEFHELILKSYGQMAQVRAARGLKPWTFSRTVTEVPPSGKTDKSSKEYLKSASEKFANEGMKGAAKDFESAKSAAEADKAQIDKERMGAFSNGLRMNIEIANADAANKPVDQLLDERITKINQERQLAGTAVNAHLQLSAVNANTAFAKIASGDDKFLAEGFRELKSTWTVAPEIALEPGFFEHLYKAVECNTKVTKKDDSTNPLEPGKVSPNFKDISFDAVFTGPPEPKVENYEADQLTTVVLTALGFGLSVYAGSKLIKGFQERRQSVEKHGVKPLKATVADGSGKPTALKTLGTTSDTSMVVMQDPSRKNDFKTSGDKGIPVSESFDRKKQNYDGYERLIADGRDFFTKDNKVYVEQKGRMFETKEIRLITPEQFRAGAFPPVEKPLPTVVGSLDAKKSYEVVILHFNDVHSRGMVNGELPAMTALMKQRAEQLQKEGKFVMVVQAGDEYSGSTVSNFTGKGLVENQVIQEMKSLTGLSFVQIMGNHAIDGADKEIKHLVDVAKKTNGEFAVANVEFTNQPEEIGEGKHFQAYRVAEAKGPDGKTLKIAVIGLTTHELEANDITFKYDVLIGKNKEQIARVAKMLDQALKQDPQDPKSKLPPPEQTTELVKGKKVDLLEYFRNADLKGFTARSNEYAHVAERVGEFSQGETFSQVDTYIHSAWDQVEIAKKNGLNHIIIASHLGLAQDQLVASRVPGVALIVGAHSHDAVHEPKMVRNEITGEIVAVTQAGCKAGYLGETTVKYGVKEFAVTGNLHNIQKMRDQILKGEMTKETAELMLKFIRERRVGGVSENPETVLKQIEDLIKSDKFGVDPKKPPVVTGTFHDADLRKGETRMGNLTADAMRAALDEHRAKTNGRPLNGFLKHMGDVREGFAADTQLNGFTLSEVFCNGSSKELVVMKVTPRMLKDILEFGVGDLPRANQTTPHDYSGNLLIPSGIKVEYDTREHGADFKDNKVTDTKNAEAAKPGQRVQKISVFDPQSQKYEVIYDASRTGAEFTTDTKLLEIGTLAHPIEKWAKAGVFSDYPQFQQLLAKELESGVSRKVAHERAGFALVGLVVGESGDVVKTKDGWRSTLEITQPEALGRYLTGKLPAPPDVQRKVVSEGGIVQVSPETTCGVDGRFVDRAPTQTPANFGDTTRNITDYSSLDSATALEKSLKLVITHRHTFGEETGRGFYRSTIGFDKYTDRFESTAGMLMIGQLAPTADGRLTQLNEVMARFLQEVDASKKNPLAKDAKIVVDSNIANGGKIVFKQTHGDKVIEVEPVFFDSANAYVLRGTGEMSPIPLKDLKVELHVPTAAFEGKGADGKQNAKELVSTLFHQLCMLDQMANRLERAKSAGLVLDNRVANMSDLHAFLEIDRGKNDLSTDFLQYRLNGNSLNGRDTFNPHPDIIEFKKAMTLLKGGERVIPAVDSAGRVKMYILDAKQKGFKEVRFETVDQLFELALTDLDGRIKRAREKGDAKAIEELNAARKKIYEERRQCARSPERQKAATSRLGAVIKSAPGTITTILFLAHYIAEHADQDK